MESAQLSEDVPVWEKCYFYLYLVLDGIANLIINIICSLLVAFYRSAIILFSLCRKNREENPFRALKSSKSQKKTLLLDLDGTLILTSSTPTPDCKKIVIKRRTFYVQTRPHLSDFLEEMKKVFNLGVYTSSQKDYADQVIQLIGLDKYVPTCMRFYRIHCTIVNGEYLKSLTLVEADLRNVLILDNRPEVIVDKRNILKIESWEGGEDNELVKCLDKLKAISRAEDVRLFIR